MQSIAKIERKKEIFKLSNDELLSGEWFDKIKSELEKGNKVEFTYINSIFSLKTYFISDDNKKGELIKGDEE
jgi:hypothetical protein